VSIVQTSSTITIVLTRCPRWPFPRGRRMYFT